MQMLGLTLDDYATDPDHSAEVWPDNALAVDVFGSLTTQWRASMGGYYGLDYAAIPSVLDMLGIPQADRADLFRDLRVMESTALDEIQSQRD